MSIPFRLRFSRKTPDFLREMKVFSSLITDNGPRMSCRVFCFFQIDKEDEQGKYYVYEDIRDHRPLTYKFFEEVTGYIKKRTKPLRFSALDPEAMKEQKPSVRISRDAMQDMSASWIFAKYGLQIHVK